MKKRMTGHHMDGLIALLLFGVFAACLLAVLLTGAGAYKRLNARNEGSYFYRTCMQYITNRVHQARIPEEVMIESFGDGDALVIPDQDGCMTRVYYYDGYLRELYSDASSALNPQDGEKVMEAGGLVFAIEDEMLTVTMTDQDGRSNEIYLFLSDGEGGAVRDEE